VRRLYLDTARLGLMKPGARLLHEDFVRFASEEGCTLYWEEFLRAGAKTWPGFLKDRYPALLAWQGVSRLKQSLKRLAGAATDSQVLLAGRSAQLMMLGARLLFRPCRNVLATDLTWPGYFRILKREQRRTGNRLTVIPLRLALLSDRIGREELAELLAARFVESGCDGLFLPAVDHMGTRLPVGDIVRAIRRRAGLRFVVVDAAQALAHIPLRPSETDCDFFIAGSHKWLGAFHPLGLGFFGHPRSAEFIRQTVNSLVRRHLLVDPLLRFTEELENGNTTRYGETVNLAPLLTAQGAADECDPNCLATTLSGRIANADRLLSRLGDAGCRPHMPAATLRSGILLLQPNGRARQLPASALRRRLHERGIAATAYDRGLLRLSMPRDTLSAEGLEHLRNVLFDL